MDTNMNTTALNQEKSAQCSIETAKEWLDARNVPYQQKTQYHLKIGIVNFYPTTGKITIDGEPPFGPKGLDALLDILIFTRVIE